MKRWHKITSNVGQSSSFLILDQLTEQMAQTITWPVQGPKSENNVTRVISYPAVAGIEPALLHSHPVESIWYLKWIQIELVTMFYYLCMFEVMDILALLHRAG